MNFGVETPELELRLVIRNHRLYSTRRLKGLTRHDLSLLSGVGIRRLEQVEQARIVLTNEEQIEIADSLNVSVKWLFSENLNEAIGDGLLETRIKTTSAEGIFLRGQQLLQLTSPDCEKNIDADSLKERIKIILNGLKPQEQLVLELYLGFEGNPQTMREIAKLLNVSYQRVQQIKAKAFRMFRHPSRSNQLKPYFFQDYMPKLKKRKQETIFVKPIIPITNESKKQKYTVVNNCAICGLTIEHNGYGDHLLALHPDLVILGKHYYADDFLSRIYKSPVGRTVRVYKCAFCGLEINSPTKLVKHCLDVHKKGGVNNTPGDVSKKEDKI